MHPILQRNTYFVKEHVGMFKASKNFDILDPESKQLILECREQNLGGLVRILRFSDYRRLTPFDIAVKNSHGQPILRVTRGWTLFRSIVTVYDENGQAVGKFRQKFFSFAGKFDLLDTSEQVRCTLKGKWTSWEFSFMQDGQELARVTKKWAGIGKELFTTADNYMLSVSHQVRPDDPLRISILAAVLCIDLVLKE